MEEEVRLRRLIVQEEEKAKKDALGMAFVTFENINHARQILRDHKNSILQFKQRCKESTLGMYIFSMQSCIFYIEN